MPFPDSDAYAKQQHSPIEGWAVPYRRVKGFVGAYEAVINVDILVLGAGAACRETVSLVVDTGTDVTIIPKRCLSSCFAYPSRRVHDIVSLTGGVASGYSYKADLRLSKTFPRFWP